MTAERIRFTDVGIFDGSGEVSFAGEVLVEGERIVGVARAAGRFAGVDARVVHGAGATLLPGLVECHAHITYPNNVERFYPHLYPPAAVLTTLMSVNNARVLLEHGFTSAYSAGAIKPGIEPHLRDEIAAGRIPGPRLRSASMEVYFPGDPEARPMPTDTAGVRAFVRESVAEGVDIIKLFLSGLDNVLPEDDWELVLDDEAVRAAAEEATDAGLWLSCHVRPVAGLKQALRYGFRMLYHVEEVDDEALDLLEARKDEVFVGPTIGGIVLAAEAGKEPHRTRAQERLARYRETVARIRARGVRVVPFGDYSFPNRPHGRNARDLDAFVRYLDFTPAEVLAAATGSGGELMGRDRIGRIAEGYLADLLLVEGDPLQDVRMLEDARNLRMIVQGGAVRRERSAMPALA